MTRTLAPLFVLVTASPLAGQTPARMGTDASSNRPADHVVLISIDGLRPEFYLDEHWPAPNLQNMAVAGAHARRVRGVTPTVTYPSHTTIVTGALPARHGVLHNRPFEPGGPTGVWYMDSDSIRVPALWDAVRAAGGKSAGISWPVSKGAAIDWNLPEYWSVSGREGNLRGPAASTAALRAVTTPRGLLEQIEATSLGQFPEFYWGRNLSREDAVGAMAGYLIEQHRPNLLVVHLNQTDYYQHQLGREHRDVRLAVAAVDRAIGRMVDAARRAGILERTAFVVTGDHGFVDTKSRLSPNVWLVEAGLQEAREDRGNWRATFHGGGGSVFLRLRSPGDTAAVNQVRRLVEAQPPEVRALYRIVEADELRWRGADPHSPLALAAVPGVSIDLGTNAPAVGERAGGGGHGYFPELPEIHTGFAAWGAGIAEGARIDLMQLTDVSEVIAALLNLQFDAPDGALPAGILAGRKTAAQ